jgi:hypothetical protein
MTPSDPVSERPRAPSSPDTAIDAVPKDGEGADPQGAHVGSDRDAQDGPGKKSPLGINEIEELESDVEGG